MDATKERNEEDKVTMTIQTATKPEGPTGEFKGDIQVDDTLPNAKMLDKAGGLMVLDADKRKHSFKSLYEGKGRILVVFIRHFFCGVGLPSHSKFSIWLLSIFITPLPLLNDGLTEASNRIVKNILACSRRTFPRPLSPPYLLQRPSY